MLKDFLKDRPGWFVITPALIFLLWGRICYFGVGYSLLTWGGPHMTAEVAVLNEQAVALATDSAITSGAGKVYTSGNKLFTLSKRHPVGIMIYNNANFKGIPLETILKVFRQELGTTSFDTLTGYAKHFVEFLTDRQPDLHQETRVV